MVVQRFADRLEVPLGGRLGDELGFVGGGGVLHQCIEALDGVEFLEVATDDGVFVRIDDGHRAVEVDQFGERL